MRETGRNGHTNHSRCGRHANQPGRSQERSGDEGFRTLTASDGATARDVSHAQQPDLILLDVLMPGETGFETCALLKSDPVTADIPIIFLSALDDVKSKVSGLKVGGVDYIAKPVHGEEVLARVRVHLRIREINRALVAEHRARLEELRDAQQAILVRPEDCPEASFAVYYKPLEEAGGDFYDVVPLGAGIFAYFVADISGHGVSAAFLTSAVKALLRQYAGPVFSPEDTMHGVDSVMGQMLGEEQYLTACYARLNRPDPPAHRDRRRAPSADFGEPRRRGANREVGRRPVGHVRRGDSPPPGAAYIPGRPLLPV